MIEDGLARARASIRRAAISSNSLVLSKEDEFVPIGDVYRNDKAFYQLSIMFLEGLYFKP